MHPCLQVILYGLRPLSLFLICDFVIRYCRIVLNNVSKMDRKTSQKVPILQASIYSQANFMICSEHYKKKSIATYEQLDIPICVHALPRSLEVMVVQTIFKTYIYSQSKSYTKIFTRTGKMSQIPKSYCIRHFMSTSLFLSKSKT